MYMPLYYFNLKLFIWEVESEKRLETEKERERASERTSVEYTPDYSSFPQCSPAAKARLELELGIHVGGRTLIT